MKRLLSIALFLFVAQSQAGAQVTKYLVKLRNKGDNSFSLAAPSAFLSARAIDRRTRYGIAIDSTDLPLTQRYLDSIASVPNVTILNKSKWLNQLTIQTTDANALTRIQNFPFVQSVTNLSFRIGGPMVNTVAGAKFTQPSGTTGTWRAAQVEADQYNYGSSVNQVKIHNGNFLHNIGLRGEGMIIGMLDAGYRNYQTLSSLDSVRNSGQILGTFDFVSGNTSVNEDDAHGVECFSTIAANLPGSFVGTAFKANYYPSKNTTGFAAPNASTAPAAILFPRRLATIHSTHHLPRKATHTPI
jgi:serine protease AprX